MCLFSFLPLAVAFKNAKQFEQAKEAYLKEAEYHTENRAYPSAQCVPNHATNVICVETHPGYFCKPHGTTSPGTRHTIGLLWKISRSFLVVTQRVEFTTHSHPELCFTSPTRRNTGRAWSCDLFHTRIYHGVVYTAITKSWRWFQGQVSQSFVQTENDQFILPGAEVLVKIEDLPDLHFLYICSLHYIIICEVFNL